jgi:arylsulfatase A-like enzyme
MNVIVVIIDSLRRDHVGTYDRYGIKTPNLDALEKESLSFNRSYPESIPTICARRAIHTGTRTWPFRNWSPVRGEEYEPAGWAPIPRDQTTLADILQQNGFATALISDTDHLFKPFYNFHQGFDVFEWVRGQEKDRYKPAWTVTQKEMSKYLLKGDKFRVQETIQQFLANTAGNTKEEDWFPPQVFGGASELLEALKEKQPFFLVVDNYDPHEPWAPHKKYVDLYDDSYHGPEPIEPQYGPSNYLTQAQLKRMRALYSGETTMSDTWLGHFLNKAHELNLLDNSLLIVLSDHGHCLGEHGYVGKPYYALYPELTDTVFMIRHPAGKGAGKTSDYYASTHDVAPTILSEMDIAIPKQMNGADLSPALEGKEPAQKRDHFTLGYDNYVWSRDERYLIHGLNDGTQMQLYDVKNDPDQRHDLAGKHPAIVRRMFNDYVLKDAGGPLPHYA